MSTFQLTPLGSSPRRGCPFTAEGARLGLLGGSTAIRARGVT